jgi:hypothetical protein
MTRSINMLVLCSVVAIGASDPWAKVREIKSGTELRIYKKGVKQPVLARMDDALEDKIIVALKDEQTAIAKEDIDRVDARPSDKGKRVVAETKTAATNPNHSASPRDNIGGSSMPGTSSSSGLTLGGKPDFQTVYRRLPAPPAK